MASFQTNALLTALLTALTPTIAAAQTGQGDDVQTTHQAHVHGAWELFAALDGDELSITMSGPLVDLLGFENRPVSEEEKAAVKTLEARLNAPEAILTLDKRAGCALSTPVAITMPAGYAVKADAPNDQHDDDHDHEGHDDHGHEGHEEHGHEGHEDHDHDDHDHDHDEHEHQHKEHENHDHSAHDQHASDIDLSYTFTCKAPNRLAAVIVTGFESFPAIETVDAVYLSDAKQTAHRLTRNAHSLKLN